jgi:hypothetical protein
MDLHLATTTSTKKNDDAHQYAHTMNLPKTDFPMRSKQEDVDRTLSLGNFIYQSQVCFESN